MSEMPGQSGHALPVLKTAGLGQEPSLTCSDAPTGNFNLVINLTRRQRAGLTIPGKLLALADEVID